MVMTYSIDLRKRVVSFVREGGSVAEASRRFSVHYDSVRGWLKRDDLRPKAHGSRQRKLDKAALKQHVKAHPHAKLSERAKHFGVHTNAIWYQLKQMKLTKKTARDTPSATICKEPIS